MINNIPHQNKHRTWQIWPWL